jgi:NADH:ubiquinone oxidoreductase subunit 6 (subunit J)
VLLFAAFRVVTARNPVHAVLNLILAFSQAAAIWLLLKAEFLGIALVLVYLGAVMVLFLFVVMMLDIVSTPCAAASGTFPVRALIGVLIAFEMGMVLMGGFGDVEDAKALVRPWSMQPARPFLTRTHRLWAAAVHGIPVSRGNRGRDPAGGHDCRNCPDAAQAQGQQGHEPCRSNSCTRL